MARVTDVILRKPPKSPKEAREYEDQKEALAARPRETVVDARYATEKSAREAAFRVNNGERKKWPSSHYYAIWEFNGGGVDSETEGDAGGGKPEGDADKPWELLIGIREYMPKGWAEVVNAPGSRKGRGSDSDVSQEGDDQGEADEEPEEFAHGEGFFA